MYQKLTTFNDLINKNVCLHNHLNTHILIFSATGKPVEEIQ